MNVRSAARFILLAAMLLAAAPSFAQQTPLVDPRSRYSEPRQRQQASVPWSSLSSEQRKMLKRFEGDWDRLPSERQRALRRGSERWLNMTPEQRKNAKGRFERWNDLPPNERRQMRNRWERFRELPPEEQQSVRENFRKFRDLPPERRRALRERWQNATPAEREHMLEQMRQYREQRNFRRPPPNRPLPNRD